MLATKSSGSAKGLSQYIVVMSKLLVLQTSSQKRGISMVPILALMPTAWRLAWMMGAIAICAGNEEAMVMLVSKPFG